MNIRKRAGLVTVAIIGLLSAAVSVAALCRVVPAIRAGNWDNAVAESLAAVVAGSIGFGFLGVVAIQWKWMAEMDRLRAAHPDQQWLWRSDWAAGRVDDSNRRKMRILWLYAILLTVPSAPLFFLVPKDIAVNYNYIAVLAFVFPAAGIGLMVWALKATKCWRKFGRSSFAMASVPCAVGQGVVGAIEFQKPFQTDAEFHLELTCTRSVRKKGSDGKTRTDEEDIWSGEKGTRLDARGTVPVEFQLPANARETDIRKSDKQITWRLDVKAPVVGTPYKASFEVPVFKV
jgi:hypothetical protein